MSSNYVVSKFADDAANHYAVDPVLLQEDSAPAEHEREAFLSGWDAALDHVEVELNKNFVPKLIKREAVKGLKEARARVPKV